MTSCKVNGKQLLCAGKGVATSVLFGTGLLIVFAWLIGQGKIPEEYLRLCVGIAVCGAMFFGSFFAVRKQEHHAAITGFLSGFFSWLMLTVGALLENGSDMDTTFYVRLMIGGFIGTLLGSMLASAHRKSRPKRGKARRF